MIGIIIAQLLQVSSLIPSLDTYSFVTVASNTRPSQTHTLASLFSGSLCRVSVKELQSTLSLLDPFGPGGAKMQWSGGRRYLEASR
jgi:hypothetical protein